MNDIPTLSERAQFYADALKPSGHQITVRASNAVEWLEALIEYIELVEGQNHDLSLENDGLREELYLLERSFYNREEEENAA